MGAKGEHELTEQEAAVLLAATKDALAKAGSMGGSLGAPFGSLGAERGGAAGGRFAARFTRPRTSAAVLEVGQGFWRSGRTWRSSARVRGARSPSREP